MPAELAPNTKKLAATMKEPHVVACPGGDETAGVNYNYRSPKGNPHMRRLLNQDANAAARTKGSIFELHHFAGLIGASRNCVTTKASCGDEKIV
ncbi:MAG: hypothetical protein ACR2JB_06855 [Bryobacteraceae bacterium]